MVHEREHVVLPFLRWAGGKRWLVANFPELFDIKFNKYIEPFLGSGSVFFFCKPKFAILSDKNSDLINTYNAIKNDWKQVVYLLTERSHKHSKDFYYIERAANYTDIFEKAAQFIYLNRTCWNGLYRVNSKGEFNVPIGTKQNVLMKTDDFENISKRLSNTQILTSDFETIIDLASNGDFVFIDPPYTVNHNKNGFIKYNEKIFSWDDQIRLANCVKRAKYRGVKITLTNANHESVLKLYGSDFELLEASRSSILSGDAKYRGQVTELIIKANI